MRKYLILLGFILGVSSLQTLATTFSPVTIRDQIKAADGVIQGEVVAVGSERDPRLGIVSKAFIKANKWMNGASAENPVVNNHIEVFFPGGTVGDEGQLVHGAPSFKVGERVVVFTRSHEGKSWVQNLGLGKFSIKKVGKTKVLVNQIFPNVPDVGQMPLRTFIALSREIKDKGFHTRFKDKYERQVEKSMSLAPANEKRGRSIASINAKSPAEKPSPLWLVFLFGLLGVGVRLGRGRRSR